MRCHCLPPLCASQPCRRRSPLASRNARAALARGRGFPLPFRPPLPLSSPPGAALRGQEIPQNSLPRAASRAGRLSSIRVPARSPYGRNPTSRKPILTGAAALVQRRTCGPGLPWWWRLEIWPQPQTHPMPPRPGSPWCVRTAGPDGGARGRHQLEGPASGRSPGRQAHGTRGPWYAPIVAFRALPYPAVSRFL